jgi:hypothetical protein
LLFGSKGFVIPNMLLGAFVKTRSGIYIKCDLYLILCAFYEHITFVN